MRGKVKQWIIRRRCGIIVGPPGVGKTYITKEVALWARSAGIIKDFEIITGCKDLSPDHICESRLVVTDDAKSPVRMIPSMIRKHCAPWLRKVSDCSAEEARRSWPDEAWLLIVFDEAGRSNSTLIDSLLPMLNDFQVTIEGETYYAPVCMILLSNPAGMDATSTAFTHALTSRLYGRITMRQPGPLELSRTYTLPNLRRDLKSLGFSPASCPDDDTVLLGCGLITALWGLPMDHKGAASLSHAAREFVERLSAADQTLAALLTEIGELQHYGPDPRKGLRLMTLAAELAEAESVPFDLGHIIEASVEALSIGGKPSFSEGQEPFSQERLEKLIFLIADRILRSPTLKQIILDEQDRGPDPSDSLTLAAEVAPGLGASGAAAWQAWLERILREHERQLYDDDVADRERRGALLGEFLRRSARMDAHFDAHELTRRARALALRPDSQLISEDGFLTGADRDFVKKLASREDLSGRGNAIVAALTAADGEVLWLQVTEEVRLATREHQAVEPYSKELIEWVGRSPKFRGHITGVTRIMAAAFSRPANADIQPVVDLLWEVFKPVGQGDLRETRKQFSDLFTSCARVLRPPFRDTFERIARHLEES
ncbi:MAG TPA: AAA family ATPase [Pirellulales bacterium]|nr:AAA family ATPase [Pirellulales bacterium]